MLSSASQLLRLTFAIYKRNFGVLIGYASWLLIPLAAQYLFLLILGESMVTDSVVVLANIAFIILAVWISIVIILLVNSITNKKKLDSKTLSKQAWKFVNPVIWVGIVVAVVQMVGFVILLVPGIIFSVWYAFIQYEIVLNNARGLLAMTKSRDLVRGRFWPTLWRLIAGPIVIIALYITISIFIIVPFEYLILGHKSFADGNSLANQMIFSVINVVIFPLFVIYSTLLYTELRKSKITKTNKA